MNTSKFAAGLRAAAESATGISSAYADINAGEEFLENFLVIDDNDQALMEAEDAISSIEVLGSDIEKLDAMNAIVEKASEAGGLETLAAETMSLALNNMSADMSLEAWSGTPLPAAESFSDAGKRQRQTVAVGESIKSGIKNIAKSIKDFIAKAIKSVENFFIKHFSLVARVKSAAEKLKEKVSNVKGEPADKTISIGTLGNNLVVSGNTPIDVADVNGWKGITKTLKEMNVKDTRIEIFQNIADGIDSGVSAIVADAAKGNYDIKQSDLIEAVNKLFDANKARYISQPIQVPDSDSRFGEASEVIRGETMPGGSAVFVVDGVKDKALTDANLSDITKALSSIGAVSFMEVKADSSEKNPNIPVVAKGKMSAALTNIIKVCEEILKYKTENTTGAKFKTSVDKIMDKIGVALKEQGLGMVARTYLMWSLRSIRRYAVSLTRVDMSIMNQFTRTCSAGVEVIRKSMANHEEKKKKDD